ncbi:MAG: apolipoprotein D and lipocalin family protein [Dinoroseobacter sp.]|jgi:apolipoprotein D and lipocalin family protein
MSNVVKFLFASAVVFLLSACSLLGGRQLPMPAVESVDLDRFMGDWYVIANIPSYFEKGAHNAIESYELLENGQIQTTFTFRADAFDGKKKSFRPKAFVKDDPSNALWGMQFVWPFKADYRIVYLNDDYSQVIIGRRKRDYVWIMSRTPSINEKDFQELVNQVVSLGYQRKDLVRVPQKWSDEPL